MFRRLDDIQGMPVRFSMDGVAIEGREGDTVAAALLVAGRLICRTTPISGETRGPFCMMGGCFECLVTIDGLGNQQACLVPLRAGMRVETQHGRREIGR